MKSGRPSATARLIAAATIVASRDGIEPLPSQAAVELSREFLGTVGQDRVLRWSVEQTVTRAAWRGVERFVAPGITKHFMRRKAWIERQCRAAIAGGFRQLVVVGAGLDTLGARLVREDSSVRVIELDHPATQHIKARILDKRSKHLVLVPADLSRMGLHEALKQSGRSVLDGASRTIVILEGLLMYLTAGEVAALLNAVARLEVPQVRVIASLFERRSGARLGFFPRNPLVDAWLRWRGEPFKWGATRPEAAALLSAAGLDLTTWVDELALAREWPGPVLSGEVLVLADRPPLP